MTTFEILCRWYSENRNDLLMKYEGQIVLIYESAVQGIYSSYKEAYIVGEKAIGLGNFLIETVKEPAAISSYVL